MVDRYRYTIDVITKEATGNLRDLERGARQSGEALDDTGSKGKRLAQLINEATDRAESDLQATDRAAEALARTLGAGLNADDAVRKLRDMGLTLDQIEQDADELGAALKRAESVAGQSASATQAGFEQTARRADDLADAHVRLGGEADKTASVMANTMGNASQELAGSLGLANVAGGTLGVTLGQLAEYAAEGGISLGGLAKQAGPMLGVVGAVALLSAAIERHKAEQEEFRKTVDDTRKALTDLGSLDPAQVFRLQAFQALSDAASDTTSELDELRAQADDVGLSASGLATALAAGREALRRFLIEAADRAGVGAALRSSINLGTQSLVGLEDASETQARAFEDLWDIWEQGDDVIRGNEQALKANQDAVRGLLSDTQALDAFLRSSDPDGFRKLVDPRILAELSDELERGGSGVETFTAHSDELFALIGSRGVAAFQDLIGLASDAGDEVTSTSTDLDRMKLAYDRLMGSISRVQTWDDLQWRLAEVRQAGADAFTEAASGSEYAWVKADEYKRKVLETIGALVDYGTEIGALPDEKLTEIQALVDQGAYDTALNQLEELSRTRTVALDIVARGIPGIDKPGPKRAIGGPSGGPTVVGEYGPEIVDLPPGTNVRTAADTRRALGGTSIVNNYTTVNMPAGASPSQVRAAQDRWARRNGTR